MRIITTGMTLFHLYAAAVVADAPDVKNFIALAWKLSSCVIKTIRMHQIIKRILYVERILCALHCTRLFQLISV